MNSSDCQLFLISKLTAAIISSVTAAIAVSQAPNGKRLSLIGSPFDYLDPGSATMQVLLLPVLLFLARSDEYTKVMA